MRAWKRAWAAWRAHPGDTAAFIGVEVALRAMALTPLLFLADEALRPLALLAVPLFLLIVPPARYSAAETYQRALQGGVLSDTRLVFAPGWGKRFLRGLRQGLLLLLWAAPLIAASGWAISIYYRQAEAGVSDWATVAGQLLQLGQRVGSDTVAGLLLLLLLWCCTLLPLLFGLAFHSGRRHEKALSDRHFLRGHRLHVIGLSCLSLLLLLPFVAATAWISSDYLRTLVAAVRGAEGLGSLSLPALDSRVWLVVLAYLALYVPLKPLRGLWMAAYVRSVWEEASCGWTE